VFLLLKRTCSKEKVYVFACIVLIKPLAFVVHIHFLGFGISVIIALAMAKPFKSKVEEDEEHKVIHEENESFVKSMYLEIKAVPKLLAVLSPPLSTLCAIVSSIPSIPRIC
jgi:hypothetical protein